MTGFWRNAEVRRALMISLVLSIVSGIAGYVFLGWETALFALGTGLLLTLVQTIVTYRRYRKMARLASDIDEILHGAEVSILAGTSEGEIAVLETEVHKMSLRLREHEQNLLADKQFLADSLADISHQLRTPLTSIHLLVSLLSKSDLTAERRMELLAELRQLLSRIDWLVETLLKLSKLDAGTVHMQSETLELPALLRIAAEPLEIPIELRGQTLRIEAGGSIVCDSAWTAEAIGNILKNCMEHTPEGGQLTVTAQENPLFSEIIITDTGSGIAAEDLPHIFERFYKGSHTDKQSYGIGLALARMIITSQNGTVKAENLPDHGAKFTVRFYKTAV